MNLEIEYLKRADKFLSKNSNLIARDKVRELVVKSIKKIVLKEDTNIDVKRLKGDLNSFYRIRSGKIRVLIEIVDKRVKIVAIVYDIDFRGNIYK
jgi:mRNA interferase RelE/StbE